MSDETNKECYFCDEVYSFPSYFLNEKSNGILACNYCEMKIPINVCKEGECCICSNKNVLIQLPDCLHQSCVNCVKTTYFGSSNNKRPMHWRELNIPCSDWPYEEDRLQIKEYFDNYDAKYFNTATNSYEELLVIRNKLIPTRPEWMNTEEFINYENENFRYHTETAKLEKEWDNYNETKIKGNGCCPLCNNVVC